MYVEEAASEACTPSGVSAATEALALLISGECSYSEAVNACLLHINTAQPAQQIQRILNMASGASFECPAAPRRLSKRYRLWDQREDACLLAGLVRYGIGDWKNCAQFIGNGKTASQCSQRWSRALNPALSKGAWTEKEDEELWESVRLHGQHNWVKVARELRSRSDVQCRYRYGQLKKMKKFRNGSNPPKTRLRLLEHPFDFSVADLMPPLIRGKHIKVIETTQE
jgi:hypothetical protein